MHSLRQRLYAHFRFRAAAYAVLLVTLLPTFIVYWRAQINVRARDEARFNASTAKVEEAFRERLQILTADLVAVTGLFDARTNLSHAEWDAFISRLNMPARHPGIRSVGFAELVNTQEAAATLERTRAQGTPGYEILTSPLRPLALPTVHVTSFATNAETVLAWDKYSEMQRRVALDTLIRTGVPVVTDKLVYKNQGVEEAEGFVIMVPVWLAPSPGNATAALRGVIFSSLVPQQMFNALAAKYFDSTLSVELFDGLAATPANRIAALGTPPSKDTEFKRTSSANLLGHRFTFQIAALPEFQAASKRRLLLAVLGGAVAFSFLLAGIVWQQGNARFAADELNHRFRQSDEQLRGTNAELERNIFEAKLAEGLLAYERDLLRMLLDHSPDAIYFKDLQSRFIKCGRAVVAHLGTEDAGSMVGKTDFDFFAKSHAQAAFEAEQNIIRSGSPIIGLVEKETWPDGRETWVLTSKMPLRDAKGNIIGTFGISKDITKLKRIELALEKEKELLAVTLRSIGDAVITTDVQGQIVLFNQVAEQLTGWTQAEAVGRRLKEVFCTGSSDSNTEILRRTLKDAEPLPERDIVFVARNGVERNISQTFAPIVDRDGQKIGTVMVVRDVTEKLRTEAELLKASKLESIGVLAGGIAHDFNNILTVILGNISLARMAQNVGATIDESLAEAETASLRARELTQRLLTFAKGGSPIKRTLDLPPLIRDCAARALQGTDVTPEFLIGDNLWTVEADESQICQVIQNLILYSRAGTNQDPRLDIHVLNREVALDPLLLITPGHYVRISIRDYGAGIQPENLSKIFEPYFSAKAQSNGLELAAAYSIVRKHEGQLRVESIVGKGTIFHVYLPAVGAVPPPEPMVAPMRRPRQRTPRHVLVMDDEMPIRRLAVHLLQHIGCTVATAADGAEAIQLYESARQRGEPFGVVIMDLTVPNGLGGKETIRRLKLLDPNVLAIVCSGYSNDPVMANFRDFGFAGVVPKPYNTYDLETVLDELFAGRN